MASAIAERNLLANVQTKDAPGCKLEDLQMLVQGIVVKGVGSGFKSLHAAAILTLMWHAFGGAIDTSFARKSQLSIATSGELFLQAALVKTSVVQGVSIYEAAEHWEQCMLHALGVLFVGSPEPSSYIFPLVPRSAMSDLPGGQTYSQDEAFIFWENLQAKEETSAEQLAKKVRTRPNVSKYINDVIAQTSQHFNADLAARTPTTPASPAGDAPLLTVGLSSHSLRRGATTYANASPKLAVQWISTCGGWLLDSLKKAFAYVETTTRDDQSVGKVLAGYKDPELPCATPSIRSLKHRLPDLEYALLATLRRQLLKNATGFIDTSLNMAPDVLDAALASMLIHPEEVTDAVDWEREARKATECRVEDGQLRANRGELRRRLGDSAVLTAAITQILSSISRIERTLSKLTLAQQRQNELHNTRDSRGEQAGVSIEPECHVPETPPDATLDTSTLAGCIFNWYTCELWRAANSKKQQYLRADLKAFVNIMLIVGGLALHVPALPERHTTVAHELWKQTVWTLTETLDRTTNDRLHAVDGKRRAETGGSFRKLWSQLRANSRAGYDVLCSNVLALKSAGEIVDDCTPATHQWTARDLL